MTRSDLVPVDRLRRRDRERDNDLTAPESRLLLIGNPTRTSGEFYSAFHAQRGFYPGRAPAPRSGAEREVEKAILAGRVLGGNRYGQVVGERWRASIVRVPGFTRPRARAWLVTDLRPTRPHRAGAG